MKKYIPSRKQGKEMDEAFLEEDHVFLNIDENCWHRTVLERQQASVLHNYLHILTCTPLLTKPCGHQLSMAENVIAQKVRCLGPCGDTS